MEALLDAQLRTEATMNALAAKVGALTDKGGALADAQADTEQRLSRLINFVSERRNGKA